MKCGREPAVVRPSGVIVMAVAVGFVVVSGALLLWLLAMVRQASRVLPPGSPVPVHGGPAGWDKWRPKESALRAWGLGAAITAYVHYRGISLADVAGTIGGSVSIQLQH
jgi:hypothetical protein